MFAQSGQRFALHFEVKNPADKFGRNDQASDYRIRANCWAAKAPKAVLPHQRASTGLIYCEGNHAKVAEHLAHFDCDITFEDIEREFTHIAKWRALMGEQA